MNAVSHLLRPTTMSFSASAIDHISKYTLCCIRNLTCIAATNNKRRELLRARTKLHADSFLWAQIQLPMNRFFSRKTFPKKTLALSHHFSINFHPFSIIRRRKLQHHTSCHAKPPSGDPPELCEIVIKAKPSQATSSCQFDLRQHFAKHAACPFHNPHNNSNLYADAGEAFFSKDSSPAFFLIGQKMISRCDLLSFKLSTDKAENLNQPAYLRCLCSTQI